ncbi:hypothetical protein K504DRAFT_221356 [Pleomassaria siparia CBS 279.74]|uniref:Uncharacterized protein n=1 Tax=Pleomassaria siparia CBS 279.74 TaxID=1314801 RepID=A0A6G1KFS7_9PLEO|nr:hypothetical protein K504DRAFT_221356 [Pleomassaria siparia CBS 279.74]
MLYFPMLHLFIGVYCAMVYLFYADMYFFTFVWVDTKVAVGVRVTVMGGDVGRRCGEEDRMGRLRLGLGLWMD